MAAHEAGKATFVMADAMQVDSIEMESVAGDSVDGDSVDGNGPANGNGPVNGNSVEEVAPDAAHGGAANVVQAADHALCLLRALVERGSLRVTDAAELLGVVPSTAYRLLSTLCHEQFAIQEHPGGVYLPGPAVSALSRSCGAVAGTVGLRWLAHPAIEGLREDTGETVSLVVLDDTYVRYVEALVGRAPDSLQPLLGLSRPAHCSAGGKALLALLAPDELRRRYPTNRLARRSPKSIVTRRALEKELAAVRTRGYSTDLGEGTPAVAAVGAAIADGSGRPLVGMSVGVPIHRVDPADLAALGFLVRQAVDNLGRHLSSESSAGVLADAGLAAGGLVGGAPVNGAAARGTAVNGAAVNGAALNGAVV